MAEFEVAKTTGQCCVTGRTFEPGDVFYSALFETKEGFERRDYAEAVWEGPPAEAICHFKTRLLEKEARKKTFVDDDVLVNFFQRLADASDSGKLRFRFVIALILLRKRILKYEQSIRDGDREAWIVRLMKDKSTHRVVNPVLDETEVEALITEIGTILHGDFDAPTGEADEGGGEDAPGSASGASQPEHVNAAAEAVGGADEDAAH